MVSSVPHPQSAGRAALRLMLLSALLVAALLSGTAHGAEWNYLQHGDDWGGQCKAGMRQSPVNIDTNDLLEVHTSQPLKFINYKKDTPVSVMVDADHYTVKITPEARYKIGITGGGLPGRYKLDSIHFHWPSEHTVDEERFILEAHFVHIKDIYSSTTEALADKEGIAVLGVLYKEGKENKELFKVEAGANGQNISLNLDRMLPYDKSEFYRYPGSLTTPQCNEAVVWTVFKNPVQATIEQVAALRGLLPEKDQTVGTYRNVQPLNGRTVQYWVSKNSILNNVPNVYPSPSSLLLAVVPGLSNSLHIPLYIKKYV